MALWFFALLIVGLALLWLAQRGQVRSGLPQGRVVYSDTGGWGRLERPLFSREFSLTGKPDYLVADGDDLIPVEVKSGRAPAQPYPSHVLQLAAYCLLVEECYQRRPPRGIVKYANRAFEVDYTPELEETLLETLDRMHADLADGCAARNHDDTRRCRVCGHREQCGQRLA
jgi:CRISPR-associated exonuclease Cas4